MDAFQKISIFKEPYCIRLTCKIHLVENMKERIAEELKTVAEDLIFGRTNSVGVHTNGAVDLLARIDFDLAVHKMLELDNFKENIELQKWFHTQNDKIFHRYGIVCRLKGGCGFDTASTNDLECRNMLLKEDLNHRSYSIDIIIPKLEKYAMKTLQYGLDAILGIGEYKLSKKKQEAFCPPRKWESLNPEEKSEVLKKIGMGSWFDSPLNVPSKIPLYLQQHLEVEQRRKFESSAAQLKCLFDGNGNVSAVIHNDPRQKLEKMAYVFVAFVVYI